MTALLVPGLFLLVFAAALRRRVDLYSALTDGASEGLRLRSAVPEAELLVLGYTPVSAE